MAQETDKKLEEDLKDRGYKQSDSNPNRYWQQNDHGGCHEIETDGQWVKDKDSNNWRKNS